MTCDSCGGVTTNDSLCAMCRMGNRAEEAAKRTFECWDCGSPTPGGDDYCEDCAEQEIATDGGFEQSADGTDQTEPCPRCLRQVPKDALEPVKYPDMTLHLCGECAADERSKITETDRSGEPDDDLVTDGGDERCPACKAVLERRTDADGSDLLACPACDRWKRPGWIMMRESVPRAGGESRGD